MPFSVATWNSRGHKTTFPAADIVLMQESGRAYSDSGRAGRNGKSSYESISGRSYYSYGWARKTSPTRSANLRCSLGIGYRTSESSVSRSFQTYDAEQSEECKKGMVSGMLREKTLRPIVSMGLNRNGTNKKLLIVNLHFPKGFTDNEIASTVNAIDFTGFPQVILGGDFNRSAADVDAIAHSLNMTRVPNTAATHSGLGCLDHILYRGLTYHSHALGGFHGSDHKMLTANFSW